MKTIEERVNETIAAYKYLEYDRCGVEKTKEMMLRVAYDQQKIDRERVCKWICASCECAENCEFTSPANCPTIKSITKAMEGEE